MPSIMGCNSISLELLRHLDQIAVVGTFPLKYSIPFHSLPRGAGRAALQRHLLADPVHLRCPRKLRGPSWKTSGKRPGSARTQNDTGPATQCNISLGLKPRHRSTLGSAKRSQLCLSSPLKCRAAWCKLIDTGRSLLKEVTKTRSDKTPENNANPAAKHRASSSSIQLFPAD